VVVLKRHYRITLQVPDLISSEGMEENSVIVGERT